MGKLKRELPWISAVVLLIALLFVGWVYGAPTHPLRGPVGFEFADRSK